PINPVLACGYRLIFAQIGWVFQSLLSRSALMSFPSGHAAVAAGLAVSLCWFYPRGRSVFIALAILASFQRINSLSHFLSDICIGAAIGIAGALVFAPAPNHADRGQ
ncbi:phosphatase PAP2 family protein, partial [Cyanobium sp. A1C-AMD]|nr:phosphatase PAP2 family protein [Cyanobium sp. A1C-AMD]